MTATQKAKQQIRDLQGVLELIEEFEREVNYFEEMISVDELTGNVTPESILLNLKESTELLNYNIDRWNELTNAKLTKVTE